ncbi:phosphoglucan, water dikinase, chloroplastic-like isoform X1 [Eucalyptus grandis]|uniref:phosphoglucan, water dikinase, chloroplastic-like isoform X1 n=1 Tax=Eucalyptus grandis TaxID=71139 RepID=UPI00192EEB66|nr:phosphoglucan, water dikinase, chloroplastic-like isoform X1 [Eucalyptus grandis]
MVVRGVFTTKTREEEKKAKKIRSLLGREKVHLSVRLDRQVEIGESVAILGSTGDLGSWKKNVATDWTKSGWVCELELKGGESVKLELILDFADITEIPTSIGSLRKLEKPSASCCESLTDITSST